MKVPLHEAACQLGLHPLNLAWRLVEYVTSFEDVWPTVDSGYVETLRTLRGGREHRSVRPHEPEDIQEVEGETPPPLSPVAAQVLDKLVRQGRWGDVRCSWDTLKNVYCKDVEQEELAEAVRELGTRGFLEVGSKKGPFNLVPGRKDQIEALVELFREGR